MGQGCVDFAASASNYAKAPRMGTAPGKGVVLMLHRVYPWLLPLCVAVLCVLAVCAAERVRNNTPEGKFSRIYLGMEREEVLRILGEPAPTFRIRGVQNSWVLDGYYYITVYYDPECRVSCKMAQLYGQR